MKPVRILLAMMLSALPLAAQTMPVVLNQTVQCATTVDGTVVGTPNPLSPPITVTGFSGTLPNANYYIQFTWYDPSGESLPSL